MRREDNEATVLSRIVVIITIDINADNMRLDNSSIPFFSVHKYHHINHY